MKTFITIILFFAFITPCFSQQNLRLAFPDEITYSGDMAYFHGSPFTGLLVDKKTNKQVGEFLNGYKNGVFTEYYPNGKKKSEANYSNGILNGKHKEWYLNGQKKSSYNYYDGKIIDGKYNTYLENGLIEKAETYRDEKILRIDEYDNGKLTGFVVLSDEFYPNNQKKSKGYLKNDKKDGAWFEWYETGQRKSEGHYINGNKDGHWITWFEDGTKQFEGNYANGKKNGQGIMNYKNDGTYNGEWKSGKTNGKGTYNRKTTNGTLYYTGFFVNDRFEGMGTLTQKDKYGSVLFKGEFKSSKLFNGYVYFTSPSGTKNNFEVTNGKVKR